MTPTPAPTPLSSIADWLPTLQTIGSLGTLAVAIAAAIFAYFQVREARRSREERSRPYVVAYLEADGTILDLVVRNFGATVARNVTMTTDVKMIRKATTPDMMEDIPIFDHLPVLVPGQEWRTLFDIGHMRTDVTDLAKPYTATLAYEDSSGKRLEPEAFVLDWRIYERVLLRSDKSLNDVVSALDKIAKFADTWTLNNYGLNVYVRSGDAHDRWYRERMEWRRQKFDEQQAQRAAEVAAMAEAQSDQGEPSDDDEATAQQGDS